MFQHFSAFSSICPRPFETDLLSHGKSGSQAFFNGLKEDSFSKDQRWVELVSMDSIDPTKRWLWINTHG